MPVTVTITIEAEDLADISRQLDDAVGAFRTPDDQAPARAPGGRRGKVSAAARAEAAGGNTGANGATDPAGLDELLGEAGLDADRGGPGDDLAAGEPEVAQSPPAARRGRPPGGGKASGPKPNGDAALPADAAGREADQQMGSAERGAASLAEVQGLAKSLGGREEKGVAAVQRVFAEHGVKTPKDIDPAKLEILRDAFEAELAQ